MKTKELIRLLQEEDPTGEEEVCVGNVDIHFVESLPAYYDGAAQVLEWEETKWGRRYVSGKYVRSGTKIQIHTLSIQDAISYREDGFTVDYSELSADQRERTKKAHDALREWMRDMHVQHEREHFLKWAKAIAETITADTEEFGRDAKSFFDAHVSPKDPLPDGGVPLGESYHSTREKQWVERFEITATDGFLAIGKREPTA
jgi:hypothetical protein